MSAWWPAELPEQPVGWTKRMKLHMNFGRGKGAASFAIFDAEGRELPIQYGYDTRPGGTRGFTLAGCEPVMTWTELRARWPEWLADQRRGQ